MFELDGAAIRSLLVAQQMTLRDLSKAAGINPTTARKVMRGDVRTNAKTAGKIAQALGVSADRILKE